MSKPNSKSSRGENSLRWKRKTFIIPDFVSEAIDEIVRESDYLRHYSSQSELLWRIVHLAYIQVKGLDEEEAFGFTEFDIKMAEYLNQVNYSRRSSRKKSADSRIKKDQTKKVIKSVLKKQTEPINLSTLHQKIDKRIGLKKLRTILDLYNEKLWIVYEPKKVGQSLKIALIGSEAEKEVRELINHQKKLEKKLKRVKRKKKKSVGE